MEGVLKDALERRRMNNRSLRTNRLFSVLIIYLLSSFIFHDFGIRYIFGYVFLGMFLCAYLIRPQATLLVTKVKIVYVLLIIPVFLFSVMPNANYGKLLISLTISMLVFSGYLLVSSPDTIEIANIFKAVKATAVLFSLYIILVKMKPDFFWTYIHPHLAPLSQEFASELIPQGYGVPIGGSSTYADYIISMALLINASDVLINKNIGKRKIITIISSSLIYFTAMLIVNRRSELLVIICSLFLVFMITLNTKNKKDFLWRMKIAAVVVSMGIVAIFLLARMGVLTRIIELVEGLLSAAGETKRDVTSGRIALWATAFKLFQEHPFTGIGWEQFMNYNTYNHEVHNTYLQWLCEVGIFGFIVIIVPLLWLYIKTILRTREVLCSVCDAPPCIKHITLISFGFQTFLLLINVIDPAFYHLNYFCFFVFSIILLDTSLRYERDTY